MVAAHQREQIEAIGGSEGTSAGLRTVVSAGLLALQSDIALLQPVADLQALANQLAYVQGRRTPCGAWWCPTDESLPPMDHLDPSGDVIAQPAAVAMITGTAALIVDAENSLLTIREGGRGKSIDAEIGVLTGPICRLPAVAAHLAHQGPGRLELGAGLWLELLQSGVVRISAEGLGVVCNFTVLLRFASEALSLATRVACRSIDARMRFERQLYGTGKEVQS
jgi:hypothetical protein